VPASTTLLTLPDGAEIHFSWPRPTDNAARAGDVTYRAMRDGEKIAWFFPTDPRTRVGARSATRC